MFKTTSDHLKLLRRACIDWRDCESGAPEINPKRPYGNSYVAGDVAEILGWPIGPAGPSREQEDRALAIHRETEQALREVLSDVGPFEEATEDLRTQLLSTQAELDEVADQLEDVSTKAQALLGALADYGPWLEQRIRMLTATDALRAALVPAEESVSIKKTARQERTTALENAIYGAAFVQSIGHVSHLGTRGTYELPIAKVAVDHARAAVEWHREASKS